MVVRRELVRRVALTGCALQHGVHPEPVRGVAGQVLGHHRPADLPEPHDQRARLGADRHGVALLQHHLLPGHRLVAHGSRGPCPRVQVSLHREPRLSALLLHHQLLPAALRHGLHLLQDLQGGRHPDQKPQIGLKTG